MRTKEFIEMELNAKAYEARALRTWLIENPNAPEEHRKKARQQLLSALQAINDLVCELKPLPPYPLQ